MNMAKCSEILGRLSGEALEFCPDFPSRASRHEAWWHQETVGDGTPLLLGTVNRNPARPVTKRFELLDEPDAWLEAKVRDLGKLAPAADEVPQIRLDFGPCLLAALMGRPFHFESDTSWTPAFIRDDIAQDVGPTESFLPMQTPMLFAAASMDAAMRYLETKDSAKKPK